MTESPVWPPYPIGPKDSIFAIGIVSTNYARLEFALGAMFSTITGMSRNLAAMLLPKTPNNVRIELMNRMLESKNWPKIASEHAAYFVKAFSILAENRNLLMHSNLYGFTEQTSVLYKTTKQGQTVLCRVSIEDLRKVADDMHLLFDYGLWISNMINLKVIGMQAVAGDFAFDTWPDKPSLPIPLEYTSNPIPAP